MKKILLIFLLLVCIISPSYAAKRKDKNAETHQTVSTSMYNLQSQWESDFIKNNPNKFHKLDSFSDIDNYYLVLDDYDKYKSGKKSLYKDFVDNANSNLSFDDTNPNIEYSKKIVETVEDCLIRKKSIPKIEVEDNEYSTLSDKTRENILIYNTLFAQKPLHIEEDMTNITSNQNKKKI